MFSSVSTMVGNAFGFMWSQIRNQPPQSAYTTDDYSEILFSEKDEKKEKIPETESKNDDNAGQRRIGKITTVQNTYGLIDNKYYFGLDEVEKNVTLVVGQTVKYFAYRVDEHTDWKIKQVSAYSENDWGDSPDSTEIESAVISQSNVIQKAITLQVKQRVKRTIFFNNGYKCDLDKIKSEFLPVPGDWVTLQADVEMICEKGKPFQERIVESHKLQTVRPRSYHGKITHLNDEGKNEMVDGIINGEVYFRKEACEPGYVPKLNDTVLASIIDSDQGALSSRAIVVIALTALNPKFSLLASIEEEKLFESKHGVSLSVNCENKSLKIGEKTTFTIKIENAGIEEQVLYRAQLKKLKHCMRLTTKIEDPVSIFPSKCLTLTVEAIARNLGFFTDLLLLNFSNDWSIACLLDYYVDVEGGFEQNIPAAIDTSRPTSARLVQRTEAIKKIATRNGFQQLVPGRRTIKPVSFLPIVMEHYPIPKQIKDICLSIENGMCLKTDDIEANLIKLYPSLLEELNNNNYLQKFHTLLHLEDLEMEIALKKYDRERACFVRKGEYLGLEIANLAESRPSLALGDKLIASDPIVFQENEQNAVNYEGYIHKVLYDMILLQFNESFHRDYNNKDYKIQFFHNRVPIRRSHQALNNVVSRLSWSWLFPDTLNDLKPVQVNIVGEQPAKHVDNVHRCKPIEEKKRKTSTNGSNFMEMLKQMRSDNADESSDNRSNKKVPAESTKETFTHEYSKMKETKIVKEILWESKENSTLDADVNIMWNGMKPRDVIVKWVNPNLNLYQKEAVRNILKGVARPLPYVIFGPPGTGKTITVVETAIQIAHLMPESRILIATPSNSSADLVCERLLSWNLALLRPGNLMRLVGYNYMLENRLPDFLKAYASCIDLKTSGNENQTCDSEGIIHSNRECIGRSRITVGTCVSLGALYTLGFPKNHFTHIIIDEAGQATEPEILIPLAFLDKRNQAILAGDPRQLGPVVVSTVAKSMGLGESLLHRLLMRYLYQRDQESYPDTDGFDPRLVTRLLINYRSLPEILDLYSTLFYESRLIAMVCPECSQESKILETLKDELKQNATDQLSGVIFHGVRGLNRQDDDSPSWYNDHEVCQVQKYVLMLYESSRKISPDDIGIITPYQKQAMRLREQFRLCGLELPKIGTVEEFQGQERQIIIVSTVRSDVGLLKRDQKHALGFVSSQQRLNVAISRARALLIIVGNPYLLSTDLAWRNLIAMCQKRGSVIGCDLPGSSF